MREGEGLGGVECERNPVNNTQSRDFRFQAACPWEQAHVRTQMQACTTARKYAVGGVGMGGDEAPAG